MTGMKMAPQIVRLLLLTIAIVGSYIVARAMLTPPSFGEYRLLPRRCHRGDSGA